MAITNAFKEAVSSGNVRRLRIMMKDSLLVDPTFEEFNQMQKLAASVPGLYDAHDNKEFVTDKNLWDDNYMNKLMVQVVYNFSRERINHLKEVVRKLRPVSVTPNKSKKNDKSEANMSYADIKKHDQETGRYISARVGAGIGAGIGLLGGGLVASAVGGSVAGGIAIGTLGGAVIGGVIGSVAENGGK